MNTRQLEYFLAVASELNFTRAAEKLYVSQTAVTKQIQSLELQLGVPLFERTKKKVILTAAGNVFQREASNLLEHWKTSMEKVKMASNGVTGSLKIGFSTGSGRTKVGRYMRTFVSRYPNIGLTFENGAPTELIRKLRAEELDLAFCPLFDSKKYEGIEFRKVDEHGLVVVMPTGSVLSYHDSIHRSELLQERLILACSENSSLGEDQFIVEPFIREGLHPNIVAKNENVETVLFMVSANIGIAILPEYLGIQSNAGTSLRELVEIPFEPQTRTSIIAAWIPENRNPSLQIIRDFLLDSAEM